MSQFLIKSSLLSLLLVSSLSAFHPTQDQLEYGVQTISTTRTITQTPEQTSLPLTQRIKNTTHTCAINYPKSIALAAAASSIVLARSCPQLFSGKKFLEEAEKALGSSKIMILLSASIPLLTQFVTKSLQLCSTKLQEKKLHNQAQIAAAAATSLPLALQMQLQLPLHKALFLTKITAEQRDIIANVLNNTATYFVIPGTVAITVHALLTSYKDVSENNNNEEQMINIIKQEILKQPKGQQVALITDFYAQKKPYLEREKIKELVTQLTPEEFNSCLTNVAVYQLHSIQNAFLNVIANS